MAERRFLNEHAVPTRSLYHDGRHDPALVALQMAKGATPDQLEVLKAGEIPLSWGVGEHGPGLIEKLAPHLGAMTTAAESRGKDRNTHGDGTVTLEVSEEKMAAQRAAAAERAATGGSLIDDLFADWQRGKAADGATTPDATDAEQPQLAIAAEPAAPAPGDNLPHIYVGADGRTTIEGRFVESKPEPAQENDPEATQVIPAPIPLAEDVAQILPATLGSEETQVIKLPAADETQIIELPDAAVTQPLRATDTDATQRIPVQLPRYDRAVGPPRAPGYLPPARPRSPQEMDVTQPLPEADNTDATRPLDPRAIARAILAHHGDDARHFDPNAVRFRTGLLDQNDLNRPTALTVNQSAANTAAGAAPRPKADDATVVLPTEHPTQPLFVQPHTQWPPLKR